MNARAGARGSSATGVETWRIGTRGATSPVDRRATYGVTHDPPIKHGGGQHNVRVVPMSFISHRATSTLIQEASDCSRALNNLATGAFTLSCQAQIIGGSSEATTSESRPATGGIATIANNRSPRTHRIARVRLSLLILNFIFNNVVSLANDGSTDASQTKHGPPGRKSAHLRKLSPRRPLVRDVAMGHSKWRIEMRDTQGRTPKRPGRIAKRSAPATQKGARVGRARKALPAAIENQKRRIAERLAHVRADRSQRLFAYELGVFQQNVNRYENGTTPHADFLITLALRENVSLDWLLLGRGNATRSRPRPSRRHS